MDLRINGITFNVAQEPPSNDIGSILLNKMNSNPDLLVVGLQEVKLGLQVGALLFWDEWTEKIGEKLVELGYYRIESLRMQGIVLSIYALKIHLPSIRDVRCDWIGTGHANFWGNKGAVAIRFSLYGRTLAVINTHLPHGTEESQFSKRISSVSTIFSNLNFESLLPVLEHDVVLLLGDLNFRIRDVPRDEVIQKVKDKTILECLEFDELSILLRTHFIFKQFEEQKIAFDPTYKYNLNSHQYDSSAKMRKPAWTDRIMTRGRKFIRPKAYFADDDILLSDHRPVMGIYDIEVEQKVDSLVEMRTSFNNEDIIEITVDVMIDAVTFSKNQDWVGLYPANFKDHRDWLTFQWAAFSEVSDSTLDVTSLSDVKIHCRISIPNNEQNSGKCLIGYFSAEHQTLIGLSNVIDLPFRKTGNK